MAKSTVSEKILTYGAVAGGAYLLYNALINPESGESSGEGSIGGSEDQYEDDLLGQQGFVIDPNVSYPEEPVIYDPYIALDQPTQIPDSTPNEITPSGSDPDTFLPSNDTIIQASQDMAGGTPASITLPQYGLGVVGLTGTYFSAFGKQLFKSSDDVGSSLLKRTVKEGVGDIPLLGKSASSFVFGGSEDLLSAGIKQGGELALKSVAPEVVESGAKVLVKSGVKRAGKTAIGLIPFVGTVAGSEFDVAVGGRSRPLAYMANAFGDVLGALSVALGGLVGISETGVGAVALGVGGQVAGEQAVYGSSDYVRNLFNRDLTDDDKDKIVNTPLNTNNVNSLPPSVLNPSSSGSSSRGSINPSRFIKNPFGGYSDTVAKQSVSSSVALSRSSSSGGSSSRSSSSSKSSNPARSIVGKVGQYSYTSKSRGRVDTHKSSSSKSSSSGSSSRSFKSYVSKSKKQSRWN